MIEWIWISLGILAWAIPLFMMKKQWKGPIKNISLVTLSFSACLACLCISIIIIKDMVLAGDMSAFGDTIDARVIISIINAVGTVILNLWGMIICFVKGDEANKVKEIKEDA